MKEIAVFPTMRNHLRPSARSRLVLLVLESSERKTIRLSSDNSNRGIEKAGAFRWAI
jgi:hypothetical protein